MPKMQSMKLSLSSIRKSPIVFLCSPFVDLIEERKAVIHVLEQLNIKHNCMELFGARTDKPIETSLSEVNRSNIAIVVLGHQYGSLVEDTSISYTEAEYREASRLNLPRLVYLKDESVDVSPKDFETDAHKLSTLKVFKELLKQNHTVAYFKNPLELAVRVCIDLIREIEAQRETQPEVPRPIPIPRPTPIPMRYIWELRMHEEQATTSPYYLRGHLPWIQDVERVTNSRVKITVSPFEGATKPMDAWENVKSGTSDIAWIFGGYLSKEVGLLECLTLPFIVSNGDTGSRVAWNLYQRFPEIQAQMTDVKILSVCTTEPCLWLTTRKQVKTLEDFNGMKIRTIGRSSADMITLLGGNPLYVPMPETSLALEVGVADGILAPTLSVLDFRLYELCKYYTYAPTVCSYFVLCMNKNVWDEMPADIQQGIMSVSGETQARRYGAGLFDYTRKQLPQIVKAKGFEINEYSVPQEELTRWTEIAGKPLWESWITRMGAEGNKVASQILEEAIDMIRQYGN